MCTGAILLFKIPRVVIGENASFLGGEDLLRTHGVELVVLNDAECQEMMEKFIKDHPNVSTQPYRLCVSSFTMAMTGME